MMLLIASILWFSDNWKRVPQTKDNIFAIIQNRISLNNFFRAESFFNLFFYILHRIFHENSWIRIALRHFLLTFNESTDHPMWNDNWFFLLIFAVLQRKHINFSLINPQLTKIDVQKVNVSTLHTRIKKLRNFQLVVLFLAHNCSTFLNSCDSVFAGNVHNSHPILVRSLVYFLWSPNKFHILQFHSGCLPNLNKILTNSSNLLEVTVKFTVQHCEIVSNPKNKNTSWIHHFIDIHRSQKSLCNVHSARWLKSIIGSRKLSGKQFFLDHFIRTNNFFSNWLNELDSLLKWKTW